jgi:hypothetical protein
MGTFGEVMKTLAGGIVVIGIISAAGIRSTGLAKLTTAGTTGGARLFRAVERP